MAASDTTTATVRREEWLHQMMPMIREHFRRLGYDVPDNIRLTCGWPHKMGVGPKKRRIGECWDSHCTTDNHFEIFISPMLADPIKVVGTLVHEVVHAVVGLKAGHKKPFAECAKMVGLIAPWTATTESAALITLIKTWVEQVGPYPHGALTPRAMQEKTEKGRMLLLECECGLKVRTTQKWLDAYGHSWACPCGSQLIHTPAE